MVILLWFKESSQNSMLLLRQWLVKLVFHFCPGTHSFNKHNWKEKLVKKVTSFSPQNYITLAENYSVLLHLLDLVVRKLTSSPNSLSGFSHFTFVTSLEFMWNDMITLSLSSLKMLFHFTQNCHSIWWATRYQKINCKFWNLQ